MSSFSQRHGYASRLPDSLIREAAPDGLRVIALNAANKHLQATKARDIVCRILRKRVNPAKGDEVGRWREVEQLVYSCPWFKVYDIIEALQELINRWDGDSFTKEINDCCIEEGIGWQLVNGQIVARGDEGFQETVSSAALNLRAHQRPTAATHIQSAIKALSERPDANTPGAVSHATNAVECLLHDITGDEMTLGKFLEKYPELFHPALKKALNGVYGYASDAGARHGKEGIIPSFAEAQFALSTCAATCSLLTANHPKAGE